MSRDQFIAFLRRRGIYVRWFDVAPCRCRDVNCKGWRIVPLAAEPSQP